MTTPEALRAKMWNDDGVVETRRVVLVLIRCEEIELVVEWLEEQYGHNPEFIIEDRGPYYRIDCAEGLEVDLDEIEPIIGHSYNVFDFLVSVSTAVGRTMTVGNKFILTTSLLGLEEEVPPGLNVDDDVRLIPCGPLTLRITEVEPLYRWEILRGDELIQEGASISPAAAERDGGKIAKLLARRG